MAAWREVEGAEDLAQALDELVIADGQHEISAAVEHASADLVRGPCEWLQRFETQRQRQSIHA
eukprot:6816117-Pyramimonas_sp.AAC.1